jgi:hypothetical protein
LASQEYNDSLGTEPGGATVLVPSKPIITGEKVIVVKGKVFYNDRRRRIDIKRPIRDLFETSDYEVGYVMELCLSEAKVAERLKALTEKKIMPVLLYFEAQKAKEAET